MQVQKPLLQRLVNPAIHHVTIDVHGGSDYRCDASPSACARNPGTRSHSPLDHPRL